MTFGKVAGGDLPLHGRRGGERSPHSRLWSLLELMKRFDGRRFVRFLGTLGSLDELIKKRAAAPAALKSANEETMSKENRWLSSQILDNLEAFCSDFSFPASRVTMQTLRRRLMLPHLTFGDYAALAEELEGRLIDELDGTYFLAIDPAKLNYYTSGQLFGPAVEERFRSTPTDIEEAGKCLALGRGTACVFHLMRVLEIGVQEFGRQLGVTLLDVKGCEKNWHNILDEVNRAIKALPKGDPSAPMLAALAALLYAVKLAWRNEVMHPKAEYTEDQADEVFQATKSFMVRLAEACPAPPSASADRTSALE